METCGRRSAEVASHISRQLGLNIPCEWSGLATALKTYRIQKESLRDFLPKGMLIFANEKMKYLFFLLHQPLQQTLQSIKLISFYNQLVTNNIRTSM